MKKEDLKIVYMGTPDFAVEPLKALVDGGYNVTGVVTMPDKCSGRGMKLQSSPVKVYAANHSIPLLQPERLKDPKFLEDLRSMNADLQIVVAFRMLPEVVWAMPQLGTFNLHASLLPQYRGAAPINWAVMNGDKETGVTTFFLKHEIDTGDIIMQEKIPIGDAESAGSVHDRLMELGAKVVIRTVDSIIEGKVSAIPQSFPGNAEELKPAPKLFRENTRIEWDSQGKSVFNFIRGLSPYPSAWTELVTNEGEHINVKIFDSEFEIADHGYKPGNISTDGKKMLKVSVADGFIMPKRLQLAGRKPLSAEEFLRGFKGIEECIFL